MLVMADAEIELDPESRRRPQKIIDFASPPLWIFNLIYRYLIVRCYKNEKKEKR
jgi:hypothetical protein